MSKIYIINKSGHDYSDCARFGEPIYLSEGLVNPFRTAKIYREFAEILSRSDRDDMILVSGLPIMSNIAAAIMAHLHGCVNWLLWDPKEEVYKKRTIKLDELLNKNGGQCEEIAPNRNR